jgi:hypothetical protein
MVTARTVQESLPSVVVDAARTVAEVVVPRRRQAAAERRRGQAESLALARAVSPDGVVLSGLFTGLRMPLETSWSGMAAYLAGTYEEELRPHLERFVAAGPSLVIDVGAAEGYYAVGLARLLPDTPVIAFDIDPRARAVCRQTKALNEARNVRVRGRTKPSELNRVLRPGALVLCDCEGYEIELLDPVHVPSLRSASILVETHDFVDPNISTVLVERFEQTHQIETVVATSRPATLPHLAHLEPEVREVAIDEGRPTDPWPMRWLALEPS